MHRLTTQSAGSRIEELSRRGRVAAERFSWQSSAELYLRAMAEIDGLPEIHLEHLEDHRRAAVSGC